MNNRSFLRVFAALAVLGSLGGCASLSKSECMNANWEDIGIRDGANGQPEEYLIQHSTACAKVNVVPDRGAWLHGRESGLERFCVPHRAYQLGEYGSGFEVGHLPQLRPGTVAGRVREGPRSAHRPGAELHRQRDP